MRDSPDIKSRQFGFVHWPYVDTDKDMLLKEKLSLGVWICIAIAEICPLLYKLGYLSSFVKISSRRRNCPSSESQLGQLVPLLSPVILFALLRFIFSASWVAIRIVWVISQDSTRILPHSFSIWSFLFSMIMSSSLSALHSSSFWCTKIKITRQMLRMWM